MKQNRAIKIAETASDATASAVGAALRLGLRVLLTLVLVLVITALLFGIIFSVSLTPCVGAFLGSALMMASTSGKAAEGFLLLLVYSLGLGVPFLLSAVLIDRLNTAFKFIKSHYRIINLICGGFLILVGILMALGLLNQVLRIFS